MCSPYPTSISLSMKHVIRCPGYMSAGKICGQRRERKLQTWVFFPLGSQVLVWLLKDQGFILHTKWNCVVLIQLFPLYRFVQILYLLCPLGGTFTELQRQNPSKLQVVNSKSRRRAKELKGKCLKLVFITFSDFLVNCKFQWTLSGTGAEFSERSSASIDVNRKMILEISTALSNLALRSLGVTVVGTS